VRRSGREASDVQYMEKGCRGVKGLVSREAKTGRRRGMRPVLVP
jgi:hypothetical protein